MLLCIRLCFDRAVVHRDIVILFSPVATMQHLATYVSSALMSLTGGWLSTMAAFTWTSTAAGLATFCVVAIANGWMNTFITLASSLPRTRSTTLFRVTLGLMTVACIGSVLAQQVFFFLEEVRRENIGAEKAIKLLKACDKVDDILRYQPGVNADCTEALLVVSSTDVERAFGNVVDTWPTPETMLTRFVATVESKLVFVCILMLAATYVVPPISRLYSSRAMEYRRARLVLPRHDNKLAY